MQVTIEKLVYGGDGLARTDQGVVFVPRTAPGDVVEAEITQRKSDYASARITRMIEPSPDRQPPSCPNYQTAGCCHWQHLRYARQLEIKESILRETLHRAGRIDWDGPIRAISGPDAGYRLRATFHVRNRKLGFVVQHSHMVVPIERCSSLSTDLNAFIREGNGILSTPPMSNVREVRAISAPPVLAAFDRTVVGKGPARIRARECAFDLHPDAFFQSNRYLLDAFIDEAVEASGPAQRVLDLFCGSGFFSIPLARRCKEVLGVEASGIAVRQARLNAELNAVSNAEFFRGGVAEMLTASPGLRPDLIVLNPPRTGAGRDVAVQIAALNAARIVYVSCNPSTFAREAAVFLAHGYTLERLTLVDQFPNTFHIELVGAFWRT